MELLKNNIRTLMIHLCTLPFFLIVLFIFVYLSPLYKNEIMGLVIISFLYIGIIIIYEIALIHFLAIPKNNYHDYFSGVLVITLGIVIWSVTYFSQGEYAEIIKENEMWIPYNLYIFLLWPLSYGIQKPIIMLVIGILNGVFAPVALKIKRKKLQIHK